MMFDGLQALIIEDDETDVDVLRSLLTRLGATCTVLYDSREIFPALKAIPVPHIIFLDLEIPGTNGYEVLEALIADPDLRPIPVVAYTSHLSEMATAREAGFHSFLGKPLKGGNFAHYLEQILNGHSVWEQR